MAVRSGVGYAVSFNGFRRLVDMAPPIQEGCWSPIGILSGATCSQWTVVMAVFWTSVDRFGSRRPDYSGDLGRHHSCGVSTDSKGRRTHDAAIFALGLFRSSLEFSNLANKLIFDPVNTPVFTVEPAAGPILTIEERPPKPVATWSQLGVSPCTTTRLRGLLRCAQHLRRFPPPPFNFKHRMD